MLRGREALEAMEVMAWLFWIWVPLVVWGAIEAALIRHWRWVATILLLYPSGALAWFIGGRRWYRRRGAMGRRRWKWFYGPPRHRRADT